MEIESQVLVPGQPHAQHIHGDTDMSQDFMCPTADRDADGDGIVSTVEGLPDYGGVFNTAEPELRLIACGGEFDRSAGSHRDNVVVFARMVDAAGA